VGLGAIFFDELAIRGKSEDVTIAKSGCPRHERQTGLHASLHFGPDRVAHRVLTHQQRAIRCEVHV
jgi:hypothetical protein